MNSIIINNAHLVTSSAADEARKLRDELLASAKGHALVVDSVTQNAATETLRSLRNFYKFVETGRETAKAPILRMGREIDALAAELAGQIKTEGERLSSILGTYDLEQKRIAEEKRQEAWLEEQRIRREAEAKERAEAIRQEKLAEQARAEVHRQQQQIIKEAEEKAARARTEAGRERAAKEAELRKLALEEQAKQEQAERERKAALAQEARDTEETRRVAQNRAEAAAIAVAKPEGTATRRTPKFIVEDAVKLYEAAPFLVTLTPNVAAITAAIKGLTGQQTIPGVKHWWEASTITRS